MGIDETLAKVDKYLGEINSGYRTPTSEVIQEGGRMHIKFYDKINESVKMDIEKVLDTAEYSEELSAHAQQEEASKYKLSSELPLWSGLNCTTDLNVGEGRVRVRLSGIPDYKMFAETLEGNDNPTMVVELDMPSPAYARLRSFFNQEV